MDQSQSNYSFKCQKCGDEHELVLCFGIDKPSYYFSIPKDEVERRVVINDDLCIIDQSHYFIRGRLTIPVLDHSENLEFNVWISLSAESFDRVNKAWNEPDRINEPPYFGWLQTLIPGFSDTLNIKTLVHTNEVGRIPTIKVIEENHLLKESQQNGMSLNSVLEIITEIMH